MSQIPQLQFSVPCLEIPEQEGPPSLNYLFYELPFPELPFEASFFVVNGWCNGKGTHQQMLKIHEPDGALLISTEAQQIDISSETVPYMAVVGFQQVPFKKVGVHQIEVLIDNRSVLKYPLTIRVVEQAGA